MIWTLAALVFENAATEHLSGLLHEVLQCHSNPSILLFSTRIFKWSWPFWLSLTSTCNVSDECEWRTLPPVDILIWVVKNNAFLQELAVPRATHWARLFPQNLRACTVPWLHIRAWQKDRGKLPWAVDVTSFSRGAANSLSFPTLACQAMQC